MGGVKTTPQMTRFRDASVQQLPRDKNRRSQNTVWLHKIQKEICTHMIADTWVRSSLVCWSGSCRHDSHIAPHDSRVLRMSSHPRMKCVALVRPWVLHSLLHPHLLVHPLTLALPLALPPLPWGPWQASALRLKGCGRSWRLPPDNKEILRQLLILRNQPVCRWYPWFFCCHLRCWRSLFSEYCMRARIVFYNVTTEHNSTFVFFGALPPIQHFSSDTCPLMMQNELLRPTSLLHRSLLSYFWFSLAPKFSNFSHFLSTAAFAAGFFMAWGRNKFVYQVVVLQWIVSFPCNMVFMMIWYWISHTHSRTFISFQNTENLFRFYWMHHSHNSYGSL